MNRVVVTGLGVVSPIGNSINEFWKNIVENNHGFSMVKWYPDQEDTEYVGAKVKDFDAQKYLDKKEARRTDIFAQYAVYAALDALADCGTNFNDIDPYKLGVMIGSGKGGLHTTEDEIDAYHKKGHGRVSVFCVPKMISNMAAGIVAIKTGFKGTNICPITACSSASHAIGEAYRNIKHGYITAAIAGGSESCQTGFAYAGFDNIKAMSRSTDLNRASIPFDAERNGFVLGEGAGAIILEEYEHAKARGAKIYAEIAGYGSTCDAYHETSPDPCGEGAAKAMMFAVEESGIKPTDVNYINAHGTSTPINDRTETAAIKLAFGSHAQNIVINSTKSLTGHLLGAAGAVEAITTMLSIQNNLVHKTLGLQVKDPDCDLDYAADGNREMVITAALSNSLGFGGHNASLLFIPCK